MTTDKQKAQNRERQKRWRLCRKEKGRINFNWLIKPEWRKEIVGFIKNLEGKHENI